MPCRQREPRNRPAGEGPVPVTSLQSPSRSRQSQVAGAACCLALRQLTAVLRLRGQTITLVGTVVASSRFPLDVIYSLLVSRCRMSTFLRNEGFNIPAPNPRRNRLQGSHVSVLLKTTTQPTVLAETRETQVAGSPGQRPLIRSVPVLKPHPLVVDARPDFHGLLIYRLEQADFRCYGAPLGQHPRCPKLQPACF